MHGRLSACYVGIGKPFKNRVTRCWEDWMVKKGCLGEEKSKTPSREEVSEWVIKSIGSIDRKSFATSKTASAVTKMMIFPSSMMMMMMTV
jgi:hypothetical protein